MIRPPTIRHLAAIHHEPADPQFGHSACLRCSDGIEGGLSDRHHRDGWPATAGQESIKAIDAHFLLLLGQPVDNVDAAISAGPTGQHRYRPARVRPLYSAAHGSASKPAVGELLTAAAPSLEVAWTLAEGASPRHRGKPGGCSTCRHKHFKLKIGA